MIQILQPTSIENCEYQIFFFLYIGILHLHPPPPPSPPHPPPDTKAGIILAPDFCERKNPTWTKTVRDFQIQ